MEMEKYELMVIIKPLLPEDVRANVQKKLISAVTKLGGTVDQTDVWGKKHLAYQIDGHDEGYYVIYKFSLTKGSVESLTSQLKLNSDIIRFLLTKI